MTRSGSKEDMLRRSGATPVVADALDAGQVASAVGQAMPEAIIHELTAIGAVNTRTLDRDFELTNRLRTEGTDNLLAAAQMAGVKRFLAQSIGVWSYARTGGPVKTEDDPLDPTPPREMREVSSAIGHLERLPSSAPRESKASCSAMGPSDGPGTSMAPGAPQFENVLRDGKFPLVGAGEGVWSFIHVCRRRRRDRGRPGERQTRHLQHRRRPPGPSRRVASGACPAAGCAGTAARCPVSSAVCSPGEDRAWP